jgi:hypothetical protein
VRRVECAQDGREQVLELMGASSQNLTVPSVLDLCDRVLGEIGRRSHLFAWLRAPGAGPQEWLAVDAYYPGNRLVVICRDEPTEHDHLYAELVPAHGLRLLELAPSQLSADAAQAGLTLRRRIAELNLPPRPAPRLEDDSGVPSHDSPVARVAASFAQATAPDMFGGHAPSGTRSAATERGARFIAPRFVGPGTTTTPHRPRPPSLPRPRPASPASLGRLRPASLARSRPASLARSRPASLARSRPASLTRPPVARETSLRRATPALARARRRHPAAPETSALGVVLGLALALAVGAELYFGVGSLALAGGHLLLALGIAFDAGSRALGVVAAGRAGEPRWAWACVIFGSPAVAAFAVFGPEGPLVIEPGPLAGLAAVLAMLLIVLAVLGSALTV